MVAPLPALGHVFGTRRLTGAGGGGRRRDPLGRLKPLDALDHLVAGLAERGVDTSEHEHGRIGSPADARTAWEVFQAMASESVTEPFDIGGEQVHVHYGDDDLLLFESYLRSEEYHLSFTRQFGFHTAELEYFGMNAVWLEVRFRADDPMRSLADEQRWGSPSRLAAWVAEVEATPAFGTLAVAEPLAFYVAQSDI